MQLSDHQAAFTSDIARLIRLVPLIKPGHRVRLLEVQRTIERQIRLIGAGSSWVDDAATAPHVEKRAADLALDRRAGSGWTWLADTADYKDLGVQWERFSTHNRWGGRYGDGNHFERLKSPRVEDPLNA